MRKRTRDRLIDSLMDAYADWRQGLADVECTYVCWVAAEPAEAAPAFDAYRAALDRELMASIAYARVIRRTTARFRRDRRRHRGAAQRPVRGRRPARRRRPTREPVSRRR